MNEMLNYDKDNAGHPSAFKGQLASRRRFAVPGNYKIYLFAPLHFFRPAKFAEVSCSLYMNITIACNNRCMQSASYDVVILSDLHLGSAIVRFFLTTAFHSRRPEYFRSKIHQAYWEAN